MSDRTITYLTDVAMLTVVVQRDHGDAVLEAARDVGATTGALGYYAKGIGMRERLAPFKGQLRITGVPGRGTTVTATVPLN